MSKDSLQGKNNIELVEKTKTNGKIKNDYQNPIDSENYLTIDVYENDKLINTLVIEHPLYKRVEYSDGKTLISKSVELNMAEFFIRLQLNENSHQLKISETIKNTAKKELTTINI